MKTLPVFKEGSEYTFYVFLAIVSTALGFFIVGLIVGHAISTNSTHTLLSARSVASATISIFFYSIVLLSCFRGIKRSVE